MDRNNGKWTEARFHSFVMSALRKASQRFPAKHESKKAARVKRGVYMCAGYNCDPHETPAKHTHIDHIEPVVPLTGFTSWDDIINRLFCNSDGLQVLCSECHTAKTKEERRIRKEHKDGLKKTR